MIPNKIMSGSGYECGEFAQEIHGRKQYMCGAITKRILQLILDLAISSDSEALHTGSELNRLEIIKFINCSLGTGGTSNHPQFGKP